MIDHSKQNSDQTCNSMCYIVGAGVLKESSFEFIQKGLLIAADGGYAILKSLHIAPDYIIGDFDSLKSIPEDIPKETYSKEKDETDMMLAVNKGFDLGFRRFVIYGGLGGRLDHSMANFQLLNYISKRSGNGYLVQGEKIITVITNESRKIKAQDNGYVSVLSLSEVSKGVKITGLKYVLNDSILSNDNPVGVSNEFIGEDVFISVKDGSLMIIWNSKNPVRSLFTESF